MANIIEYDLVNKSILTKVEKSNEADFVSMKGGMFKTKTTTKKLLKLLSEYESKSCGLSPVIRRMSELKVLLDFDFKTIECSKDMVEKICKIIMTIIESLYEEVEEVELYVFTKENNLHIYSNLIMTKEIINYLVHLLIIEFEKSIMKNVNSTNGAIIDNLNNFSTGIRLEGFNKVGKDKNFTDNSFYQMTYKFNDDCLSEVKESRYNELLKSCYYDISFNALRLKEKSEVAERVAIMKNAELDKKALTEHIDFDEVNVELLAELSEYLLSIDKELLAKVFKREIFFKLLIALKNYLKYRKMTINNIVDKLNNEFFGKLSDLDNTFTDIEKKNSYRKNNKNLLKTNFNNYNNVNFGHVICLLNGVDIDLAKAIKEIIVKKQENVLEELTAKFKKDNHIEIDNFNPAFFRELRDKNYPLNKQLTLEYAEKHFIFTGIDDQYYNVYVEPTTNGKGVKIENIKLQEFKEGYFRRIELLVDNNKSVSVSNILKESNIHDKYVKIGFIPNNNCDKTIYNLFNGFDYEKVDYEIKEEQKEIFNTFLIYVKEYVCENSQEQFDYLMTFLANIIQNPDYKPHICPIFYSDEKGTGKSSFTKLVRDVIGSKYSFFGNIEEVLDKHSTANEFKFINVIEEIDNKNGHNFIETLKNKIQAEVVNINRKFKNILEINDFVRYFILTNNRIAMLDRNHRRFVCYHFKKVVDGELLKIVNEVYEGNRLVYAKMFGEYLSNWNIKYQTRNDWINGRAGSDKINYFVKTNIIEILLEKIYQREDMPLGGFRVVDDMFSISKPELYKLYENVCSKGQTKFVKNKKRFIEDLHENFVEQGLIVVKEASRERFNLYEFDLKVIHSYLVKIGLVEKSFVNNYSASD